MFMTVKKSDAFLKIDAARDAAYKFEGYLKVQAIDLSSTCYYGNNPDGEPVLIAFIGRSKKPALWYRYRTKEARNKRMREFMESCAQRAERRKPETRALSVGDILSASWGYEQTNVDYYKVIELVGSSSVKLVEVGKQQVETLSMQGKCIPDPEKEIGAPFTRRVDGVSVRVNSSIYASLKKPEIINGAKIYSADYWTSYA